MSIRNALVLVTILAVSPFCHGADPNEAELATQGFQFLKTYCYRCHGLEQKSEGLLVLQRDGLIAHEKKYLVPGKPDESLLWKRVGVDKDMPEGDKQPTEAEVALFKRWIAAGAPFPAEAQPRVFISQAETARVIRDDLQQTDGADRPYRRYFSLVNLHNNSFGSRVGRSGRNIDDADLPAFRAALSKLLNSLSWEAGIVVPVAIDPQQTILRIDLRDLGWSAGKQWNDLLKVYPYGLTFGEVENPALRNVSKEAAELSGSPLPVVRVDWFLDTASRPPLYHSLLNLPKTLKELEKLLRLDSEANFLRDRVRRAGFAESGVSVSNRLVERHPAPYGAFWLSADFKRSEDKGNLFQFPLGPEFKDNPFPGQAFEHDGGEMIFNLPNGLQAYFLTDGKGTRIDAGPTEVVRDLKETSGSIQVVNGLSCMACHEHGMRRFADSVRNGTGVLGQARLKVQRIYPEKAEMDKLLAEDEARYLAAIDKATGPFLRTDATRDKPIRDFPEPIYIAVKFYQKDLELDDVASELGMADPKELQVYIKANGSLRQLGLGPLVPGNGGKGAAIKRSDWSSLGQFLSKFQRTARELELGTPHRPL